MKKTIGEYINLIYLDDLPYPDVHDAAVKSIKRVLRQLANDVREECAKTVLKNRPKIRTIYSIADQLNNACREEDARSIRNLKLFEEL